MNADVLHVSASAGKPLWIAAALECTPPEELAALAEDVFRTSSNERTGDIIDFVGIDAVNDFLRRIGLRDSALIRWRYGRERRTTRAPERMGEDNYFTARDAVRFLSRLHDGSLFEDRARTDALLHWMKLSPREGHCGWLG
ncbi:MAG TPA: serine hydrolase, partial [Gemmatimonadaceae bacterium]|nr:serine hydrolase [Gemmatimonadaceae bacterium]